MKQLKTDINGGFPLKLDDLRWMHLGVMEAIKGVLPVSSNATVIISGCNLDVYSFVTNGSIMVNGEIFIVPSHNVTGTGTKLYWEIIEEFDINGTKTFQDSFVHDTYLNRYAKVVRGTSVPLGSTEYQNTFRIEQIYKSLTLTNWTQIGLFGLAPDNPMPPNFDPVAQMYYKLNYDNQLIFQGQIDINYVTPTDVLICTLPNGYRPVRSKEVYIPLRSSNTVFKLLKITIESNGEVKFVGAEGTGWVYLNNIPPINIDI